ncbi:hypothetical protein PMAYCL1PPCAC_32548, partial [Pristionchus mayeri]
QSPSKNKRIHPTPSEMPSTSKDEAQSPSKKKRDYAAFDALQSTIADHASSNTQRVLEDPTEMPSTSKAIFQDALSDKGDLAGAAVSVSTGVVAQAVKQAPFVRLELEKQPVEEPTKITRAMCSIM